MKLKLLKSAALSDLQLRRDRPSKQTMIAPRDRTSAIFGAIISDITAYQRQLSLKYYFQRI
ncbi:MAG: hypothetical protein LBU73_07635 [Helicobacteraceae bacterium]|nr:hypothetical protein [Helicobacteraceae bacterium]